MLKLSCQDHKTFSLHLGLHIGYKDYICLLTYSINCNISATNINIYCNYCYKTWLRQRTLIFTIVRPNKKITPESDSSWEGTKVPGSESSRERKFHGTFVPGSESSRERKFQRTKVPWNFRSPERKFHPMELSFPGAKVLRNESSSIHRNVTKASTRMCGNR